MLKALPEDPAYCQTDNGSEFCGPWNAKKPSAYTDIVESLPGQIHTAILPGANRMQADVETVHMLMETEFYEIETFADRADFISKANPLIGPADRNFILARMDTNSPEYIKSRLTLIHTNML